MLRTLVHYWRVNLAVAIGAAVAAAVLAGALLVGDSVRGSLRDLTLDRLGGIDSALVLDRFFRDEVASDLGAAAPAIVLRGSGTHPDSGSRASRIGIHGIDERFTDVFGAEALDLEREVGQIFPSVVVNESLRRELNAEVGDAILLSFGRWSHVPRETLMGEKDPDAVLGSVRLILTGVLPDRGLGRFGLRPQQQSPLNAFVALQQLQRSLDLRGRINALFLADSESSDDRLRDVLRLEDFGLVVERREDYLAVESREFVLRPAVDETIGQVASELGAPLMRTQSYLANSIEAGERELPYSLVAGLDPIPDLAWASLPLADGSPGPTGLGDELFLNTWAAEDLGVSVGDTVEMSYYVVGSREELREERTTFRVGGVVAIRGLGADRDLTPDYPGIQDAQDISSWDPPFPVELDRVRAKDELYWDDYGATPKAFVSEATGRRLWSTRFGVTTAVRIGAPAGQELAGFEERFRRALRDKLSPEAFGFRFQPVKQQGLKAAAGATDFSGLFISFSFFLIVSAALLIGLLFRLGVEQRAGEIGLLLAVGHRVATLRRRLLAEGGWLAAIGGLVGLAGGVGYAWLMMAGLRTVWRPAVGSSELYLHVRPMSLITGWAITLVVVLLTVFFAMRKLVRVPPPQLLAGSLRRSGKSGSPRRTTWIAFGGLAVAVGLLGTAVATRAFESPGLAFGIGASVLISGLAFFARWCRGSRRRSVVRLAGMAVRNSSWNPGRSMLSVALVGSACFMIVVVEVFRVEPGHELESKESATGGFALVAESDVPLLQDLNLASGRFDLGFSAEQSQELSDTTVYAFRSVPGDDVSCLNLYRPEKPRLLGVSPSFVERGGFAFQERLDADSGDPWALLGRPLEQGVVPAVADWNSATWILHMGLGDELVLDNDIGEPVRLRLVGLLRKGILQSEVLISEENFLKHFPDYAGDAYFLIDAPGEKAARVAQLLEKTLAPFGFDVSTTRDRLAGYEVVQNTYLSTFQVLGGLGLLLGTVGLGVVLVRNVIERRGELATLRAFGFRRSRLAAMVLAENAFLLLVGIAIGVFAAMAAVAPRLAAGHLPWRSLLATLAVVLLIGMLSSVAAVLGALRVPLLPALKAER